MKNRNFLLQSVFIAFLFSLIIPSGVNAEIHSAGSRINLKKVALFKSGVGYFELRASVEAGKGIELHFKREQMNDLLKSLTILDLSGGQVGHATSVVYDSTKTAKQQLSDYAFDLRKGDGLPQVLKQLQGSKIELIIGSHAEGVAVTGTIVGVETRITMENQIKIPRFYLSIMDSNGQLRSFDTNEISGVKFLDQRLNQDIKRYLTILFQKHRKDEKTVLITPMGEGRQELLISYVTEVPVWKATYRIIIPEGKKGVKPFLQGWAIIDNVTGKDWKNVQLSLISGLPISFIQNLYDPQFKKRPLVKLEQDAPVAPVVPEAGMRADRMVAAAAPMAKPKQRRMKSFVAEKEMKDRSLEGANLYERMRQLKAATITSDKGEMFEYRIDHPVTIARNRSALVPIVATEIKGQAVDLYNEKIRAKNPLAAVRLKNTTGLTLEGGPLTVFQGGSYAGDALVKTFKPDEKRYITYAVDLGLRVNTKMGTKSEQVDRVIINRGVIRMRRGIIETKTYNLDNKNPRSKTVVIEHPFHANWKLLNKEKPIEITDNYLRFEVKVPELKITKFSVREMRESWERIMISNLTPDQIIILARKEYLSESTQKKLEQIVALKSEISNINRGLKAIQKERGQIFEDQKRLRENLRGLRQTTEEKGLRNRYVKRLNQQETRLEELRKREKVLNQEFKTKQGELNRMIKTLEQDLSPAKAGQDS
ncbi:MAG: hypothetical protein ISR61_02260 [Desulfobacteraceae bacterium]|uniref:DUF4139 domain-containing protein n=1 Tax=Candidatus Desulfacyla euxinica TaxID=2841693 RepID=A0A8J6MZZ6_9DELT|nr:hypothetical protein [Candidatus Desulfacyla euxinica]MBL6977741.1 hypothetical protein [Desulfobacteraceae bacterium]